MSPLGREAGPRGHGASSFATTRWSMVIAAGHSASPQSRQALEQLCRTYWYPLYSYVRRQGCTVDQAQDLTQEFFAVLLEKDYLRAADRERGRFRCFLLACVNHFLANQWRQQRALKRGGGRAVLSLDLDDAERRYALEPYHDLTPQKLYERRWALTLLDQALTKLRGEYAAAGKALLFDRLAGYLAGQRGPAYQQAAQELGMTEGAVKVAVHRLRRRCRWRLREEVAQTVAGPEEIDAELRHLLVVLGS